MATTGTTLPNKSVAFYDPTTSALTYVVATTPSIVYASASASSPSLVACTIVVTNPSNNPVNVQSITFGFPVGTGETDLMVNSGNIVVTEPGQGWVISCPTSSVSSWYRQLCPAAPERPLRHHGAEQRPLHPVRRSPDQSAHRFLRAGHHGKDGHQSPFPDHQQCRRDDHEVNPLSPTINNVGATITKYPPSFFFDSLVATVPVGSANVAVAQVANGTAVTLVWNVSTVASSAIQICYSTPSGQQVTSPTQQSQWTSPPLTCDTVFTVSVTFQTTGGQPVTRSLSTAVSVASPTLAAGGVNATSLAVSGSATFSGTATVPGTLNVTGGTTMAGVNVTNNLGVSGNTILGGGATINNGAVVNQGATINGSATINAGSTLNNGATINGSATVNGGATINGGIYVTPNGPVSLLNQTPETLTIGTLQQYHYSTYTDGFLIGSVQAPVNITSNTLAVGWINASTSDNVSMYATGGNFYCAPAGSNLTSPVNGSWCLPLRRGASVTVTTNQINGTAATLIFTLQWLPMGSGNL